MRMLLCGIIVGCGSKPPIITPESGEYKISGSLVELICPEYFGFELGDPYGRSTIVEFFDDGSVRVGGYPPENCNHNNGVVTCSDSIVVENIYFVDAQISMSWDSSTEGMGSYTEATNCDGDNCGFFVGDCVEPSLKAEFEMVKVGEVGEEDTASEE
jgi:hypothetical protein